jgi:2Fe-2S ferredoxin
MVKVVVKALDGQRVIEATPGRSLMLSLVENQVLGIEAACGGSEVCGTCHAYIDEPHFSRLPAQNSIEVDMLEFGVHVKPNSRLTCQIPVTPELEGAVITVPPSQR